MSGARNSENFRWTLVTVGYGKCRPISASRDWLLYGEEYGRTKFGNCQKLPFNDASNWAQNTKFT